MGKKALSNCRKLYQHKHPFLLNKHYLFVNQDAIMVTAQHQIHGSIEGEFIDCLFTNNDVMYEMTNGVNAVFINCTFENNTITTTIPHRGRDIHPDF